MFVVVGAVGILAGVLLFVARGLASDRLNDFSERSASVPSGLFTGASVGCSGVVLIIFSMVFLVLGVLNW